jgi:uncharacterized protein (TIGR00369 family)
MPRLHQPHSPSLDTLERIRAQVHPHCIVCSPQNASGLHLSFTSIEDGQLVAEFACPQRLEGYPGRLQGGVIASLMDGIMANCLFAHGIVAVTTELNVRYRHPVEAGTSAELRGQIERESHGLYFMRAELRQNQKLHVTATAKFFEQDSICTPGEE